MKCVPSDFRILLPLILCYHIIIIPLKYCRYLSNIEVLHNIACVLVFFILQHQV